MSNNSARSDNMNANTSVNSNTRSNAGQSPADVSGVWGGLHLNIEVSESGATLDYDCAHGTITERIVPDREGKFSVKGFHVRERPGPTREGEDTEGQPATYSGSINNQTMTLTVKLSRTNEDIGTFTLTQGKWEEFESACRRGSRKPNFPPCHLKKRGAGDFSSALRFCSVLGYF